MKAPRIYKGHKKDKMISVFYLYGLCVSFVSKR